MLLSEFKWYLKPALCCWMKFEKDLITFTLSAVQKSVKTWLKTQQQSSTIERLICNVYLIIDPIFRLGCASGFGKSYYSLSIIWTKMKQWTIKEEQAGNTNRGLQPKAFVSKALNWPELMIRRLCKCFAWIPIIFLRGVPLPQWLAAVRAQLHILWMRWE